MNVGVVDSGLGGLTVVKSIKKKLPHATISYFGDTARCPYGNKTKKEIKEYTYEMVAFLCTKKIDVLVIACNTATAILYEELRKTLKIPVIGMIEPGVTLANRMTKNGRIGLIATTRTIESGVYQKKIKNVNKNIEVLAYETPLLVPIIEKGTWGKSEMDIIKASLFPLKNKRLNSLILGCTHYPIIEKEIVEFIGSNIKIVNPAEEVATVLEGFGYVKNEKESTDVFYVSGDITFFKKRAENWLKTNVDVEKVF